jgi:transcriptional regulator GlxA family with amidase domain
MEQTQAVVKMQEFIKRHSDGEITIRNLADVCGYSPWHAYRLFARLTGFSPAEYIRKLRLSESALRLRDAKVKALDVAEITKKTAVLRSPILSSSNSSQLITSISVCQEGKWNFRKHS